jgi:hypothetical protein
MAARIRIAAAARAVGVALTFVASAALADVTLQHRISVEGIGIMSAGNMSGTTRTTISGERARTDSDLQLQSRIVRMLAHGAVGPTAEIIRLDQDKVDQLDVRRKQYTEVTFAELKARLQKAIDQTRENQGQGGPQAQKPMDDSKCEWLDPKVDVRRPGEKATYAGFEAERLTIVASQPCKDKETGAICEVALSLDEWLAPKFTSSTEAERFHRAYAQKIGLDLSSGRGAYGAGDISQRAQSMFGRYAGIWGEIASKTRDVKGYPVRMSFAFAFGGEQCKNAPSQQQKHSSDGGTADTPAGLAGQMAGKLGSLFHRKKDDSQSTNDPASQPAQAASVPVLPGGLVPVVTLSSELMSVSTDSVSADVFEVPADFKKVDRQRD